MGRDVNPGHNIWAPTQEPSTLFSKAVNVLKTACTILCSGSAAAKPGRDTNPRHPLGIPTVALGRESKTASSCRQTCAEYRSSASSAVSREWPLGKNPREQAVAARPWRSTNPRHPLGIPALAFGRESKRADYASLGVAFPVILDCRIGCFGMLSLCEVLSTVSAGAFECRRCFRDFRIKGTWGRRATATQLSQSGKFSWLRDSPGQTDEKATTIF